MTQTPETSAYLSGGFGWTTLAIGLAFGAWLLLDPAPDLAVSALFYDPGQGFVADQSPTLSAARKIGIAVGRLFAAAIGLAIVYRVLARRNAFGIPMRALIFLAAVQIAGPALLVNGILKEHWGRARPVQVTEFNGTKRYTPPLVIADQCAHNCSFVSGEASYGYSYLALGFVPRERRWRHALFAFGAAFGTAVGIMRIAQGGHFLSDIFFSAAFMLLIAWLLHRLILDPRGIAWFRRLLGLARGSSQ